MQAGGHRFDPGTLHSLFWPLEPTLLGSVTHSPIPAGIAASPDGTVWFTQETKGSVARITNDGVVTEGKALKGSGPFGITVAANGDPWYTMMAANKIATLKLRERAVLIGAPK